MTQDAFFDVRVFHPNAPSYRSQEIATIYKRQESAKKREYNQRVRDVERGVFTPLVFSTTGGMGREAGILYKRLADMISVKQDKPFSVGCGVDCVFQSCDRQSCASVAQDPPSRDLRMRQN